MHKKYKLALAHTQAESVAQDPPARTSVCDALAGWSNRKQINSCSVAERLPHAQAAQGANVERRDTPCGVTRLLSLLAPLQLPQRQPQWLANACP